MLKAIAFKEQMKLNWKFQKKEGPGPNFKTFHGRAMDIFLEQHNRRHQ